MDRSPKPQSFPDHIGETLAQQLRAFSFDGDEQSFHEAFQDHLAAYGHEDPCGRKALSMVNLLHNPLSFRSDSTCRKEITEQGRKRWRMWLDVFPLDLQLSLLNLEYSRNTLHWIPLERLKWDQLEAVVQAKNPAIAFQTSPLAQDKDLPDGWQGRIDQVRADARQFGGCLIAGKKWDMLDEWLGNADIHPWEGMRTFMVHHRTRNAEGALRVRSSTPLPFWASGMYAGATEDEFWEIMVRHGGPSYPTLEEAPIKVRENLARSYKMAGDGRAVNIHNPGCLADLLDNRLPEAFEQAEATASFWRDRWMAHTIPSPPGTPPVKKPGSGRF